jgi:hypothetical protein
MTDSGEWVILTNDTGDTIDLVSEAQAALAEQGYAVERDQYDLHLPAFGLTLYPRGVSLSPSSDGARSVTVVYVTHAIFASGLFEYQHGIGKDPREALRFGLSQWAQLDLPVLCDATRDKPENCALLEMEFPAGDGQEKRKRRIVLGPVMHMAQHPEQESQQTEGEDEHSFCPCCLTTNCLEAFRPLLDIDEAFGVRLLASRSQDGETSADCRINGEDFHEGMAALRAYAERWPERGFEMRKQYVIFQTPSD